MTEVAALSSDQDLHKQNARDKGETDANNDVAERIQTTDEGGAAGAGSGNMANFVDVVRAA